MATEQNVRENKKVESRENLIPYFVQWKFWKSSFNSHLVVNDVFSSEPSRLTFLVFVESKVTTSQQLT